jgi:RHS repeat-associated protein
MRRQKLSAGLIRYQQDARLDARADPRSGDVVITDRMGYQSRYTFGKDGFVDGFVTPMGRNYAMASTRDGDVARISNPAGREFSFGYNSRGTVSSTRRGARELFRMRYDDANRLVEVTYYDETTTRFSYFKETKLASVTNRLGHTERTEYSSAEEVTALIDGNGNRTAFEYSKWNRPVRSELPDGSRESYAYDEQGRLLSIRNTSEPIVEIAYDGHHNPTEFRYGDGRTVRFQYTDEGLLIQAVNDDVAVSYEYNEDASIACERHDGREVRAEYDAGNRLTRLTYTGGATVRYFYDRDGRVTGFTDWNGGEHSITYKHADRGYQLLTANGLRVDVTQSSIGLPVSYTAVKEGQRVFSQSFQYDVEDRLLEVKDSAFGNRSFQYDAEGEIVAASRFGPAPSEKYRYDGTGNRLSSPLGSASFNSLNQLTKQADASFEYDGRGNMTTYTAKGGWWRLKYNSQNLLASAEGPQGQKVAFTYDAFGRRIRKQVFQGSRVVLETTFIWSGEHLIAEASVEPNGTVTQEYLYWPGTHIPLATRINGVVYNYHCDHNGTPMRLTDSVGRVVWAAVYSPFGQIYPVVSHVRNPLRFAGHYHDNETDLHYNRFRYYSPQLGRYLSRDPLSFLGGVNLYAYVGNDPINRRDPFGLWWKAAVSIAVGALAAVGTAALIVATAPVSLPALAIGAAAVAMGVGVGLGTNKALNLKEFNAKCFFKAFGLGFLEGVVATAAVIGLMVAFPAAATGIALVAAGVGIYSMMAEHFGWPLPRYKDGSFSFEAGKPYSQMTPEEQNRSLGGLTGGLVGSAATGAAAQKFVVPRLAARTPSEPVLTTENVGPHSIETVSAQGTPDPGRVSELGINHEQGGVTDLRQGLGGAHYEQATGRSLSPSTEAGGDFVENGEQVSMKGPLVDKAGKPVPIKDEMVDGLANSAVKDVRYNTATKRVIVDTAGMTPAQRSRLMTSIKDQLAADPGMQEKEIVFVE